VKLLVLILATWRLTSLFTQELGPFDVFERLRDWVGEQGHKNPVAREISRGLACFWCNSLWWATLLALLSLVAEPLPMLLLYALAASAGAILLEEARALAEDLLNVRAATRLRKDN
jgi:hypothetical protein